MTTEPYYSLSEAAVLLSQAWPFKVTPDTLRRWVRQGRVPVMRSPTGRYYIAAATLQDLSDRGTFDEGTTKAPADADPR